MLLAFASSASALSLGLMWTGDPNQTPLEMESIGKSGASLFRVGITPERSSNGANWEYYDSIFGRAAENGVTILPQFGERMVKGSGLPTSGEKTEWTEWAQKAVRRYGYNGIYWSTHPEVPAKPAIAWEMWNEPNNAGFGGITATEYGAFLAWAGKGVQEASESWGKQTTGVLFGGLLAWSKGTNYQTYLKNAYNVTGASSAITGVAIHPYELNTSEFLGKTRIQAFKEAVNGARTFLNSLSGGSSKSLWITETGWPAEYEYSVSDSEQANLLTESFDWAKANAASLNLHAIIWYNHRDINVNTWQYHCGLRKENGTYRLSWYAFQKEAGVEPTGSQITAFEASNNELWYYPSSTGLGVPTKMGMDANTSPSVASIPHGGGMIAFQDWQHHLWTYSTATGAAVNTGLGIAAGTSPAIAYVPGSGYVVAFQDWGHHLWTYSTATGTAVNTGLGMLTGTSPSIAVNSSDSSYAISFDANNNELWYYVAPQGEAHATKMGMDANTSPAIGYVPGSGYRIAFEDWQHHLWSYSAASGTGFDTTLGMLAGTAPNMVVH